MYVLTQALRGCYSSAHHERAEYAEPVLVFRRHIAASWMISCFRLLYLDSDELRSMNFARYGFWYLILTGVWLCCRSGSHPDFAARRISLHLFSNCQFVKAVRLCFNAKFRVRFHLLALFAFLETSAKTSACAVLFRRAPAGA